MERQRTRSETTDPVTRRHCPSRGGGWEQHRRVGSSALRSGSTEEGMGCVVGENQPITIDGHVNARDREEENLNVRTRGVRVGV